MLQAGRAMRPLLYFTLPYWKWLGLSGVRVLGDKALHAAEPGVDEALHLRLFFPQAGIVCPYGLTIAMAENAVQNGAHLSLDTCVTGMDVENGRIFAVHTNRGTVRPRIVINAAGVFCEDIAQMAQDHFFSIHPRKGTNAILDKKAKRMVRTIYSGMGTTATKTVHSKGGGIVSTVDGNVLVGPDAVETLKKKIFPPACKVCAPRLKSSAMPHLRCVKAISSPILQACERRRMRRISSYGPECSRKISSMRRASSLRG